MPSRRNAIKRIAVATSTTAALSLSHRIEAAELALAAGLKGQVNHSVCRWCYNSIPLEELCLAAKNIGLSSIELTGPDDWPVLKKYGLTSAMPNGAGMGIEKGFNDPRYHDELVASYEAIIPKVSKAGLNQIICFSGNRNGLDDEKGIENCAVGLKRLMPIAEKHKVTIVMELLNSKVNHKDYMCDRTPWGAALCEKVGSAPPSPAPRHPPRPHPGRPTRRRPLPPR